MLRRLIEREQWEIMENRKEKGRSPVRLLRSNLVEQFSGTIITRHKSCGTKSQLALEVKSFRTAQK